MKKILSIVVLYLFWCNVCFAANYLFKDNLYTDCDIIKKNDPSSFLNISFEKEKKINFWDRRKQKSSGWKKSNFKAFLFEAKFEKSKDILVRVNSEFKTKEQAEKQAVKYGKMVGQLPKFLRKNIKTLTIHKGNKSWGGGNRDILIHIGDSGAKGKCAEEVMMHEGGHTSLDWAWGGSINSSKWKKAAKADNKFITKYAKQYPGREDVAETINWWIAVRCKPDTISKLNYKKILEGIPNRLKYLDEQNYDTFPLTCN